MRRNVFKSRRFHRMMLPKDKLILKFIICLNLNNKIKWKPRIPLLLKFSQQSNASKTVASNLQEISITSLQSISKK